VSAPSDAQLREMFDEFQLRKLVHGYCRAVDRGDIDALRGLYHDDADIEALCDKLVALPG